MTKLETLGTNFWTGRLPAGCQFCREGAKLVLYITGQCQSHCYYCPVSRDRMYTDVAFANEKPVTPGDVSAVLEEARAMRAQGAGITGGDPMTVPDRVIDYCRAFKAEFGPAFHIHLYTQNLFDPSLVPRLEAAGLDEIRFHPPVQWWGRMDASPYAPLIRAALRTGMTVGCEVPAIPAKEEDLYALASWCNAEGAAFLNLNELEFSEANMQQLFSRGFELVDDESNIVEGGREAAWSVVQRSLRERMRTTVHFCASTYKDSVQLRKRLLRRLESVERPLDVPTEDGTILFGAIEPDPAGVEPLFERLVGELGVPVHLVQINRERQRIEVAPWILEELVEQGHVTQASFIVEVLPTATRVEVERTPLPDHGDDWDDDDDDGDDEAEPPPQPMAVAAA